MFWLVMTSLKDSWGIFKSPWGLPGTLHWVNYQNAMEKGALAHKIWNSIVIDGISLVLILLFSSMAAYVLGRFRFAGNRPIFYMFLSGMTIPVFLAVVPLFVMMNQIHLPFSGGPLLGTRLGLIIIYVAYSLSFTIFVLTGFFKSLPWELAEAAVIDGCTPSQTFWKIMLPLAKPGLATAGIFVFIGLWNEYPLALVLVQDESVQTLPLGIANLTMTQKYAADWGALFAGLTIGVLPTLIMYIFFQRQIQAGLTAGAVKG
jgi:N-acetylglucosamine transport system permease protein